MIKIFVFISFAFIQVFLYSQIALASSDSIQINTEDANLSNKELNQDDKEPKKQISERDIFGDEQTFPFVAGLGKNAAH